MPIPNHYPTALALANAIQRVQLEKCAGWHGDVGTLTLVVDVSDDGFRLYRFSNPEVTVCGHLSSISSKCSRPPQSRET